MNVVDLLFIHARERPTHPAVETNERVVNYAVLASLVERSAASLRNRGIKSGNYVVLQLPDSIAHVVVLLALAHLNAIIISVDPRSSDQEKSRAVEGLNIRAAIVQDKGSVFLDQRRLPVGWVVSTQAGRAPVGPRAEARDDVGSDLPMMMIQSSGTTGDPKRLLLTHKMLAERLDRMAVMLGLGADDRYLQVPYLRFAWGREVAVLMIMRGATIVLNEGVNDEDFVRYFFERGITYVSFTLYHLRMMLRYASADAPLWPDLKIGLSSAPSTDEERHLARRRLTPHLFEIYGTNEAADLALATPDDQDRHPDSCGRLLPGIEAEVVDPSGNVLPFGEIGEIRFRGAGFAHEYLGNPEATGRHFKGGWFYPGDLAALNEAGYVFLKGRTDHVINNAGAKYFPTEIEAVLLSHPAVDDVAVIGGPHPRFGEASVAYVVRSGKVTPKELYKFCEGKIAMYKAPQWVFFLDALPRIATGKADLKQLKAAFQEYLERQKA